MVAGRNRLRGVAVSTGDLVHRLVLDRLLGTGTFQLTDDRSHGQRRGLVYRCGCRATEHARDRYEVASCPTHRTTLLAERLGG